MCFAKGRGGFEVFGAKVSLPRSVDAIGVSRPLGVHHIHVVGVGSIEEVVPGRESSYRSGGSASHSSNSSLTSVELVE